jgi:hypothetical protein
LIINKSWKIALRHPADRGLPWVDLKEKAFIRFAHYGLYFQKAYESKLPTLPENKALPLTQKRLFLLSG